MTVLARFGTAVEDIDAEAVRAEAAECQERHRRAGAEERSQVSDADDPQKKLEWCEAQLKQVGQAA